MNFQLLKWLATLTVFATLAVPVQLLARGNQEHRGQHHKYKAVDLGTLGGPASFVPNPWSQDVNRLGAVIAEADTPTPDAYSPHCFQPTCLVNHGFKWQGGIRMDLGALPGANSSFPAWINHSGDVAGFSENGLLDPLTGFPEVVAVVWKDRRTIQLGTFGGNASYANSINNLGQIVGGALNANLDPYSAGFFPGFAFFPVATQFHAFLWQDGVMHDLGTLGGSDSGALFINEHSQIAGASYTNSVRNSTTGLPTQHPFLWVPCDGNREYSDQCKRDRDDAASTLGKMLDLGTLGGTFGSPYWLNDRGQVVGLSNLKGDIQVHPFLWDGRRMKDLGTFGGNYGAAYSVNDAGETVGFADFPGDQVGHAFLWRHGVMNDLGTPKGSQCSLALSINSSSQIVGQSQVTCGPNQPGPGWLWENGGPMVELDALFLPGSGIKNAEAVFINDRGEIAANGVLPDGAVHAVLLIPCDQDHPDLEGCEYDMVDAIASPSTGIPSEITAPSPSRTPLGKPVSSRIAWGPK